MSETESNTLRIIAIREGDLWVAQCLEYDICVQGEDLAQAKRRMKVALEHEARITKEKYGVEYKGIPAAPDFFKALFDGTENKLEDNSDFRIAA